MRFCYVDESGGAAGDTPWVVFAGLVFDRTKRAKAREPSPRREDHQQGRLAASRDQVTAIRVCHQETFDVRHVKGCRSHQVRSCLALSE